MTTWRECKKILCIRPDNMGDLLMSSPAITALKETFGCSISLLTSSMAKGIAPYISAVDETLVWDAPWVKGTSDLNAGSFCETVEMIKAKQFDAAVIFTVFSQNPLPTALMATLAGIPFRLAYCRENPYRLLSHWERDEEPYNLLRHQVRRDLDLVRSVGARAVDERIHLRLPGDYQQQLKTKLQTTGLDPRIPWLIMHPGVSEQKRIYPEALWIDAGKKIINKLGYQIILTGVEAERELTEHIQKGIGKNAFSIAGLLSIEEFITLVRLSSLMISVNTGPVHLAAAVQTKVIVLYALTNPQHSPWKAIGKLLPFSVPKELQSNNEVLRFVHNKYYSMKNLSPSPEDIYQATRQLLIDKKEPPVEELVLG